MGGEKKKMNKKAKLATVVSRFSGCFCSADGRRRSYKPKKSASSAAVAGGPEGTMIAAAKHFSSAHKIRFG